MEPKYKDESIVLFIAIGKIAMGILGVFSFFYIISAIGLLDFDHYFPAPQTNSIVMDKSVDYKDYEFEKIEVEKNELNEKDEQEETISDKWSEYMTNYNEKIEKYFNRGFYYDLYKDSFEKNSEKEYKEENDKEYKENFNWHSYFNDDYGFNPNLKDYKKYFDEYIDFDDLFSGNYLFY